VRDRAAARSFDVVRVDTAWEARQQPVFGGDPASEKRSRLEALRLPLYDGPAAAAPVAPAELSDGKTLWLIAPDLASARAQLAAHARARAVELELGDYSGLESALGADGTLDGRPLIRALARTPEQAEALLAVPGRFEVVVHLSQRTRPWLLRLSPVPARLVLVQPTHERLTESSHDDVDLLAFFAQFGHRAPAEGLPRCITPGARAPRPVLDTAMMTPSGQLEIFRFTQRFILAHYYVKSLRCAECVHESDCLGLHVNYVRAQGFAAMQPITAAAAQACGQSPADPPAAS